MKRLPLVISLAVVALVAVVTGCGGARYDSRLAAADSLMHDHPDSALALVEAVNSASLTTEGDRAYRDLLLTQARYRCYITATSDSAISCALDYYRRHSGEREKLTRAYIYKGAVMEELGHPDSAMFYYKHAEATATSSDYFNLGYINLKIGELYQNYNAADSIILRRMRKATSCFSSCGDTILMVSSIGSLGVCLRKTDKDSSIQYLEKAISLANTIHSCNRFFYQSKLAGIYFYQNEYIKSRNLSLDIIRNGKDCCDEDMFYYYAARSFIKLGNLDSACWVESIIPRPVTPQDSFNYFLLQADLAKERQDLQNYGMNRAKAERIHRRILDNPTNSKLMISEIGFDSSQQEAELKGNYKVRIFFLFTLMLTIIFISICISARWMKGKFERFQDELNQAKREIEELMESSEAQITALTKERDKSDAKLIRMTKDMSKITKKYRMLELKQENIHDKASAIVRERNAALKVLYQEVRLKMRSLPSNKMNTVTLLSLINDFHESGVLLNIEPKETFWRPLKLSVDSEFNGIATFIEKKYPNLTLRDHHLFWLLCANVSPHIIKLCMNYTTVVTVSNNKRRLIQEKMGMDVKFEEFINMYLNGDLGQ